jgi:hypothetical protein
MQNNAEKMQNICAHHRSDVQCPLSALQSDMCSLFNRQSEAETASLAIGLGVLTQEACNFLSELDTEAFNEFLMYDFSFMTPCGLAYTMA